MLLRADGDPLGMVAFGIPSYGREKGLASLMGVAGTEDLVKSLIANGFPVMVVEEVELPQGCVSLDKLPCQQKTVY